MDDHSQHNNARPDVVVFVADDLGVDDVGYAHAGGPRAFATPTIDKLARKSLRLTRFYGAPMCTPARAASHDRPPRA